MDFYFVQGDVLDASSIVTADDVSFAGSLTFHIQTPAGVLSSDLATTIADGLVTFTTPDDLPPGTFTGYFTDALGQRYPSDRTFEVMIYSATRAL
jgi:hypothetical protein